MKRPLASKRPIGPLNLLGSRFEQGAKDVKQQAKNLFDEVYEDNPIDMNSQLTVVLTEKKIEVKGETVGMPDEIKEYNSVREYSHDMIDVSVDSPEVETQAPSSIAASAYFATSLLANDKKSQADVADMFDSSATTIREHYGDMLDVMERAGIEGKL